MNGMLGMAHGSQSSPGSVLESMWLAHMKLSSKHPVRLQVYIMKERLIIEAIILGIVWPSRVDVVEPGFVRCHHGEEQ